jgi:transposase
MPVQWRFWISLFAVDRKTIRKYILKADTPTYRQHPPQPSKLELFKPYLEERLQASVMWSSFVA